MDTQGTQEILGIIASFGAGGVLALWLKWALSRMERLENELFKLQIEYRECLRDCHKNSNVG